MDINSAAFPGLAVVIGTRAQLIKMAPVLRELEACRSPYVLVFTGQHRATMRELLADFEVRTQPKILYEGPEISGLGAMAAWFPRMFWRLVRRRAEWLVREDGRRRLVVVHGDTVSTLLGAAAGRWCRARVAHIESGLRSFRLFNPFPEEVTRLLVFRLANIAFCPGDWAAFNMASYQAEVVNTGQNTLLDAVRYATGRQPVAEKTAAEPYCVVSLHRFENLFNSKRLVWIVATLKLIARTRHIVFVLHPATEKRLTERGLLEELRAHPNILLEPRMTYVRFLRLLHKADFVITDGGSNQEELYYLGKPTMLYRDATERHEGLGEGARLIGYRDEAVRDFLEHMPAPKACLDSASTPSQTICRRLLEQAE